MQFIGSPSKKMMFSPRVLNGKVDFLNTPMGLNYINENDQVEFWKNKCISQEKIIENAKILEIYKNKTDKVLIEYERKIDLLIEENNGMNSLISQIILSLKLNKNSEIAHKILKLIEHNSKLQQIINSSNENVLKESMIFKENRILNQKIEVLTQENDNLMIKVNSGNNFNGISHKVNLLIDENEKLSRILESKLKKEEEYINYYEKSTNFEKKIDFLLKENEKLLVYAEDSCELKKKLIDQQKINDMLLELNKEFLEKEEKYKEILFQKKLKIEDCQEKLIQLCEENENLRIALDEKI